MFSFEGPPLWHKTPFDFTCVFLLSLETTKEEYQFCNFELEMDVPEKKIRNFHMSLFFCVGEILISTFYFL